MPRRRPPVVGWDRARVDPDARHPGRDRPPRPRRHHGRHPELQERRDDRLRRPRGACRARPVLPGPQARARQLRRRLARRHPARGHRDRAAGLRRVDPPRPADEQARPGDADLPRDRRRRRQGRGAAHDLRDRGGARGPGAGRRRQRPALASSPSGSSCWPARSSRAATTTPRRCTPATSTTARSPTPSPTR